MSRQALAQPSSSVSRRAFLRLAAVVIGAGFLAGGREALAAEAQVTVSDAGENNAKFEPGTVTVATGGTVTWTNQSSVAVTVTSADGLFDSEEIPPGGSFSQTFDSPGRFRYFCVPLPSMKGTVVVTKN